MENLKKKGFRNGIKERRFFERVTFGKKGTEDVLIDWIYWLEHSKNIRIERFMNLLWGIGEITFPIKIKGHIEKEIEVRLIIIDTVGNEFYLKIEKFSTNFSVSRYDLKEEEKWILSITKPSTVKIVEYYNSYGEKFGIEVNKVETSINYKEEENLIKAVIRRDDDNVVVFKFKASEIDNDKEIVNIIKKIEIKDYYSVFIPLVELRKNIKNPSAIIGIQTFVEEDKLAEIEIVNGYVTKETDTKILYNSNCSQTNRRKPNILLEDYLRKNKYKYF